MSCDFKRHVLGHISSSELCISGRSQWKSFKFNADVHLESIIIRRWWSKVKITVTLHKKVLDACAVDEKCSHKYKD